MGGCSPGDVLNQSYTASIGSLAIREGAFQGQVDGKWLLVDLPSWLLRSPLGKLKRAGILPALWLLAAPLAEPRDDLAERSLPEVEVAFDGQASAASDPFKLREHEVAPFFLEPDDVAKEPEVVVFLRTFG